jgi:hypothetical protein
MQIEPGLQPQSLKNGNFSIVRSRLSAISLRVSGHCGLPREGLSRYEMYYGRERFRGWVLVSPTMERQNENYLAGVVRTERCNNAVWQRHMGESR